MCLSAENEPNNSIATANVIQPTGTMSGTLAKGDADWYIVTLPDDGEWTVSFTGAGDLRCDFLDIIEIETGHRLARGSWGTTASVKRSDLGKHQYLLYVPYWDGTPGSYTLSTTFTATRLANDSEPNNTIEQAVQIALNTTITGRLNFLNYVVETDDNYDLVDWYKVVTTESGKLIVNCVADDPLRFNDLKLYDSDKTTRLAIGSWGKNATVSKDNLLPGTYYLYIPKYDGNGSYSLTTQFTMASSKDDIEPNNTQSQSQTINFSDTVYARLGYENAGIRDDYDWYKVTLPENGKLNFKFITEAPLRLNNPKLRIENDINRSDCPSWGNNFNFEIGDLTAGEYWLMVPKYDGYGSYKFIAEFTPYRYSEDKEPNNNYLQSIKLLNGETVTGHLGNWRVTGDRDIADWYQFTLPQNGKVVIDFLTDSVLSLNNPEIRALNDTLTIIRKNSPNWRYNFSFEIADLEAGTYFLYVPFYDRYGAYKMTYNYYQNPRKNDTEPNNTFRQAIELKDKVPVTGQLGYFYSSKTIEDKHDWFKVTTAKNGTLVFKFLTDSLLQLDNPKLYSAVDDSVLLWNTSSSWRYNFNYVIENMTAGDYYLYVPRYEYYGGYDLNYEFIPDSLENDTEPNNNPREAIRYNIDDTVTGHLGMVHSTKDLNDADDFYAIRLPRPGILTLKVVVNEPLTHELYLYQPDSTTLHQRHSSGYDKSRTMVIKDMLANTDYFLKIHRYDGKGNYKITSNYLPVPTAIFKAIQNLSTVYLNNESLNAETSFWDFGDGNTSTKMNPTHSYSSPGYFTIKLKASNQAGVDSVANYVSVRGIQSIVSDRGGNGGNVTARINAGDLKNGAQVLLRKNGVEIEASGERFITPGDLEVRFNLYQAQLGKWDVVVKNPGESEMILKEAFLVEEAVLPDVWADVQGRDKALFGRWQSYTVTFGNRGNIDALSRIIWIVTPDGDSVDVDFQNVNFDFPKAFTTDIYSALKANIPFFFSVDTINGEARKARVYGLMLSEIPANSEMSVKLRVKSFHDFEVSVFQTESFIDHDYNASKIPMTRSAEEYSNYESCVRWAIGKYIAGKVVDVIANQIPGADCLVNVVKTTSSVSTDFGAGELSLASFAWTMSSTVWACAKDFPGPWKAYETACDIASLVMDLKGVFDDSVDGYNADQECQKYKKKLEKKRKVRAVSSFDPNEMIGPKGFGKDNVVSRNVFPYTILFENVKTASAAAQEVVILDTLDITKFNTNTFKFTGFGFGGKDFSVVQDSNSFVREVDLRPSKNAILRVSGAIDPIQGNVKWQFLTLDPETMDLTEDPEAGFLPPNVNSPEGDGYVSFVVDLNESIMTGDTLENIADIYFDLNKPIKTNLYKNIIDESKPSSRVVLAKATEKPGEIELDITGSDTGGAGVMYYDLYIAVNDSSFVHRLSNIQAGKLTLKVPMGKTYKFFTLATDSLNLVEPIKSEPDAMMYLPVSLSNTKTQGNDLNIVPNPVSKTSEISFVVEQSGKVELIVINPAGQVVRTIENGFRDAGIFNTSLDVPEIDNGVYFLKLTTSKGVTVTRFIVKK